MKMKQSGFTLLELLVVLLIIGMLAAFVGPKYFGEISKSQTQVAAAQIASFAQALDQFHIDTGRYPTSAEGLNSLYVNTTSVANWNGPYLKVQANSGASAPTVPLDPWGNAYNYALPSATPSSGRDYDVISYGADGKAGGTGVDADITN